MHLRSPSRPVSAEVGNRCRAPSVSPRLPLRGLPQGCTEQETSQAEKVGLSAERPPAGAPLSGAWDPAPCTLQTGVSATQRRCRLSFLSSSSRESPPRLRCCLPSPPLPSAPHPCAAASPPLPSHRTHRPTNTFGGRPHPLPSVHPSVPPVGQSPVLISRCVRIPGEARRRQAAAAARHPAPPIIARLSSWPCPAPASLPGGSGHLLSPGWRGTKRLAGSAWGGRSHCTPSPTPEAAPHAGTLSPAEWL